MQKPLCARPGCTNHVRQLRLKYCSHPCSVAASSKNGVIKQALVEDRLIADISTYLKKHPFHQVLKPVTKKGRKATAHEMVLLFSDTHYPEVVDPAVAMGLEYNPKICQQRMERMRDVAVRYKDLRAASYPVQKLTVACLGDMLSGNIHEELEITNAFPMSESLVKLAYMIHDLGLSLAQEFPEVELVFLPGNHPRMAKKPRMKMRHDNFDYVLGHFVAALAGKQYQVNVPKDIVYIHKVFESRLGMCHGDGTMAASFAGIPWYGLKNRRDALQALLHHLGQPPIDYLLMGHFHQAMYWSGTDCDLIVNGAVKGGDEYSIVTRHASQDPVQLLLTFHKQHGLTDVSRINLL